MSANFEFRNIPGRILVSRTLNESERRLVGCVVAVEVERDFD
jgi:hypothetical protein